MGDGRKLFRGCSSSQRGVSLLELTLYLAVMAILGAPLAIVTVSVSRSSAEGDMLAKILERNRSALERITREYRESLQGTTAILNAGKSLRFTSNGGFDGTATVAGPVIQYEIRLDPGETQNSRDDNGNGLTDESILVRVNQNTGEEIVVAGGLSTANCSFAATGTGITVNFTTAGYSHGASQATEAGRSITIYPRN